MVHKPFNAQFGQLAANSRRNVRSDSSRHGTSAGGSIGTVPLVMGFFMGLAGSLGLKRDVFSRNRSDDVKHMFLIVLWLVIEGKQSETYNLKVSSDTLVALVAIPGPIC